MALTVDQIKNATAQVRDIATQLRKSAEVMTALADTLSAAGQVPDPVPVPSSPPPPIGGFTGRGAVDAKVWKTTYETDFPTICAEGKFLTTYGDWDAYPSSYPVTDRGGRYEPNNISVIDQGGTRVLNCALKPGNATSDGKPWSTAPYPKKAVGAGLRVEMRVRVTNPAKNWHAANLLWPTDEQWPKNGEIDFLEFDFTGALGAFLHLQDATDGGDQIQFSSSNKATDWHVVCMEWIAGTSFKLFHDGKQISSTVTSRVPKTPMRLVLQTESYGQPTQASAIQYDWISVAAPA